mmetsp:Transcript_34729/g.97929  ORF Transcript_34729/g.97929 Transcript_34729/m.97929 type:complete len:266 (-) Transcript_34729:50-847(-)|eukprot:CAMPEP_0119118494 /NCGR_PEP_ID=MMETSP1310-20130426/352_1 /TAXON_ID=464262 /ORGANISM="Genus nov. species nov., Strain RCC2339" /LENGTH=265 /DNA_ID=CAMNT_0007107861 /DNA_START=145 /DNA_END=942 /DNA_ORIENTATION=+
MASAVNDMQVYSDFQAAFEKSDFDACRRLLGPLKLEMTKLSLSFANAGCDLTEQRLKEFLTCRHILELAALFSVRTNDMKSFERNVIQVKTYYRSGIPESDLKYKILGLYLLHLLASHRHAEFLTELELIPYKVRQTDENVKRVVELENWLVVGRYSRVFAAIQSSPSNDVFAHPLESLLALTRQEMARCLSKAYDRLPSAKAQEMLHFKDAAEWQEFVNEQPKWTVEDGDLVFAGDQETNKAEVPAMKLISRSVQYAKELERIV